MQKGCKAIMFYRKGEKCCQGSSAVYVGNVKVLFKWRWELVHEQGETV
jgi:hypothetical protein